MMRLLLTVFLGVGFGLTANGQPSEKDFDRFDKDRSGSLSAEELPQATGERFKQFDADGDGSVSRPEFRTFVKMAQERMTRRAENPSPRNLSNSAIRLEENVPYAGTKNPRQSLDVLKPENPASDKLPAVVFIHGGGWRGGNKESGRSRIASLVSTGEYVGFTIGYRLSNEAQWPEQIFDCKAAIRHIRANAKQYGIDPEKIAVMGTSAGGHLVLMLGTSGDVPALEGDLGPHDDVSSRVHCVVNFFGPTDLRAIVDQDSRLDFSSPTSPVGLLLGGAIADKSDAAKQASPVTFISADDPPILTLHGTADPTVPYEQALLLDRALESAGQTHYLVRVEGGKHGGFPEPETSNRVRDFLDKTLRGKSVAVSEKPIEQFSKD